jgi:hypothetical protein
MARRPLTRNVTHPTRAELKVALPLPRAAHGALIGYGALSEPVLTRAVELLAEAFAEVTAE